MKWKQGVITVAAAVLVSFLLALLLPMGGCDYRNGKCDDVQNVGIIQNVEIQQGNFSVQTRSVVQTSHGTFVVKGTVSFLKGQMALLVRCGKVLNVGGTNYRLSTFR